MTIDILATLRDAKEAMEDDSPNYALALVAATIEQIEKAEPDAWEWVHPEKGMQLSHNEPADYEEVFELRPLYLHPAAPAIPENIDEIADEIREAIYHKAFNAGLEAAAQKADLYIMSDRFSSEFQEAIRALEMKA